MEKRLLVGPVRVLVNIISACYHYTAAVYCFVAHKKLVVLQQLTPVRNCELPDSSTDSLIRRSIISAVGGTIALSRGIIDISHGYTSLVVDFVGIAINTSLAVWDIGCYLPHELRRDRTIEIYITSTLLSAWCGFFAGVIGYSSPLTDWSTILMQCSFFVCACTIYICVMISMYKKCVHLRINSNTPSPQSPPTNAPSSPPHPPDLGVRAFFCRCCGMCRRVLGRPALAQYSIFSLVSIVIMGVWALGPGMSGVINRLTQLTIIQAVEVPSQAAAVWVALCNLIPCG